MAYYGEPYDPMDRGETLCKCGEAGCALPHAHRVQISSYCVVVADETFGTPEAAEAFIAWYFNSPDLPQGGALMCRADKWWVPETLAGLVPQLRERFIAANYRNALVPTLETQHT